MRSAVVVAAVSMLMGVGVATADQVNMKAALKELRAARKELRQVATGKGSLAARTLQHVDRAIDEVRKGVEYGRDK
jgi:hypothetical protein